MTAAEFLRIFPLRAPNLAWLLGAGSSAASGIPTAGEMIWDFKRQLYCSEQRISIRACDDLGSPIIRSKIQRYLESKGGRPVNGADEEYSHYFSAVYPNEADRRRYIDQMISKASPSFGFNVLAVLMKLGHVRVVWTTNFDRNVEDASALVWRSTGKLVVASLDAPHLMREALQESRWPVLGKLHGDFQSRRLKNTSEELQTQDAQLRRELVETCKRFGLIALGYSGRDQSVMDALTEGIDSGRGFPAGVFWFVRTKASAPVDQFISRARAARVDAHVIQVETFDELLADVFGQFPNLPKADTEFLETREKRMSEAPMPSGRKSWPVVRLNALQVVKYPTLCRLVKCGIGGAADVNKAIEKSGAKLVAARRQSGVIMFGSDAEAAKAFADHAITGTDVFTIEARRFYYDSVEAGLVYKGLVQALARERHLIPERRRFNRLLRIDPAQADRNKYAALKAVVPVLHGTIPGTNVLWAEAMEIRLSYRLGRLWLLIDPVVWADKPSANEKDIVREFQRERLAQRYNKQSNGVLQAWCDLISAGQSIAKVSAFGINDGVDAAFEIGDTTAFSWRAAA